MHPVRQYLQSPQYNHHSPKKGQNIDQTRYEEQTPQRIITKSPLSFSNNNSQTQAHRIFTFIGCVCMIYLCLIISGVIEQRIYKVPYSRNNNTTNAQKDYYNDPITPFLVSSFFAAAIGYIKMDEQQLELNIPLMKLLKLAVLEVAIHFGLMWSLISASYVLIVMANSCGLLSVILIGVYYSTRNSRSQYNPNHQIQNNSRQTQQNDPHNPRNAKIGPQKILICFIVCAGIFVFNYFSPPKNHASDTVSSSVDSTTQSASWLTFLVLAFVIILQGFRPQLQTRLKQEYQPSPICFYYNYNKAQCLVALLVSLGSMKFFYTIDFILHHDELFIHIIIQSLLIAVAALFIFKIITMFRQHVYPLVGTVRKCITVGVSILYFGHKITVLQLLGILMVFGGVLLEIAMNYKLLQKWNINLPFVEEQRNQRYVKNKNFKNQKQQADPGYQSNTGAIKKKYQVYKILDDEGDIQGI